jgi:hypothetical protein
MRGSKQAGKEKDKNIEASSFVLHVDVQCKMLEIPILYSKYDPLSILI